jgi:hypothetical protein
LPPDVSRNAARKMTTSQISMNIRVHVFRFFGYLGLLTFYSAVTSAQWYYPINIGNRWEYWDAFPPPQVYGWTTKSIGDTLMPNKLTYRILRSDGGWGDQFQRQVGSVVYQYVPYSGIEEVFYDFSKHVGDTVAIRFGSFDTAVITVTFDYQAQIFGRSLRVKEFYERAMKSSMYVIRTIVDSIGLVRITYEPGEGGQAVGAIIDGTKYGTITDVVDNLHLTPATISLEQNYPNPFNPTTTITFSFSHPSLVTLKVINILGQDIATLLTGRFRPGTYSETWNGEHCPTGVYLYRLTVDDRVTVKRMLLIK